jgi:hypothetical protein
MSAWNPDELGTIGAVGELRISSRRPDGSFRPYVTIWAVAVDGALYARSAYGPDNPWYRRALASGSGRIQAGGVEREVRLTSGAGAPQDAIDAAYHAKYDQFGQQYVGPVVGHALAVRIDPDGE